MGKSVMKHQFSMVPQAQIQRSTFDRTHGHKTTFDAGYLVPFFLDEALPGDTFSVSATVFARMATPIKPLMDNMFMDTHWFFIPNRLVWENWEKFCGAQDDPGDSTDYTIPVCTTGTVAEGALHDYLGVPTGVSLAGLSALPSRCYKLVWNEWFRDQNLQDSQVISTGDGPDTVLTNTLLQRGKRHDYFTSSLPWPQKGDSVSLPLGTRASITTDADVADNLTIYSTTQTAQHVMSADTANVQLDALTGSATDELYADLSNATAATINSLRQAFQIQKLLERDARGGTRYQELVKSHFGVTGNDARFQRPEFLGSSTTPIIVNPVQQQSSTDATSPQGNLAGFGTGGGTTGFTKSFVEHGYILGLVSVRADLTYQQGVERMWSRSTRYDFYWPALAHIGEQAVLNKEIYAQGTAADDLVFGYQERFAEYRYKPSRISGAFRSNAATSLDLWHLSQEFGSLPTLDTTFIKETPPVSRVVAVPSEPEFLFDSYIQMRCARPMPVYGVPGLIDHF